MSVNLDGQFTVAGYRGVAFWLKGYATTEEYEGDYLVCDDDDCDHDLSGVCWSEGDTSIVTDLDRVVAVMVGDDREHVVDVEDLTEIGEEDYCSGCGQVGWGPRPRPCRCRDA